MQENSVTRLIPVPRWSDYHDYPTENALRHLIFQEKQNGFYKVIKRIGRRVLIDERAFFAWVEEINKNGVKS